MTRTLLIFIALTAASTAEAPKTKPVRNYSATVNPKDAKNTNTGKPAPPLDPELAKFYMEEKTAPLPPTVAAEETKLPLVLKQGDHVVFIGNTLFDRGAQFPYFEAMLQKGHADLRLVVRTLAWAADEVDVMPRPSNFGTLNEPLPLRATGALVPA